VRPASGGIVEWIARAGDLHPVAEVQRARRQPLAQLGAQVVWRESRDFLRGVMVHSRNPLEAGAAERGLAVAGDVAKRVHGEVRLGRVARGREVGSLEERPGLGMRRTESLHARAPLRYGGKKLHEVLWSAGGKAIVGVRDHVGAGVAGKEESYGKAAL